jgi:hypothetical protein
MSAPVRPLARWRLGLLRLAFAILAIGQASFVWPALLGPTQDLDLMNGVAKALLGAIGLCAAIGVLRPLQMLPVMLVEIGWKVIWMSCIALPAWLAGRMDADMTQTLYECLPIIPFAALIPWDQMWQRLSGGTDPAPQPG